MSRQFGQTQLRALGDAGGIDNPTYYTKFWKWNRSYAFKYNPFKSLSIDYSANDMARIDELDGANNTKEARDYMLNNLKNFGRNTNFSQTFNASYTLPINKIPLFDFITANVSYNAAYSWIASALVRDSATNRMVLNPLGNMINNSQQDRAKVDFNFKKIYDKWSITRVYSSPNPLLGDRKASQKKKADTRAQREKIKDDIGKLKDKRDILKGDIFLQKCPQLGDILPLGRSVTGTL